jgi:hypothetical protein
MFSAGNMDEKACLLQSPIHCDFCFPRSYIELRLILVDGHYISPSLALLEHFLYLSKFNSRLLQVSLLVRLLSLNFGDAGH